jgi:TorA maturation chaperone TorD
MTNDLEKYLVARALFYRFLALMYNEPGDFQLSMLADVEEFQQLKEAAEALDREATEICIGPALDQLQGVVHENTWNLRDLRVEYNRLFVGPTKPLCHPYESVYDLDREEADKGTVMGPSASFFENALAVESLEVDLGRAELYDHVAIELEFMFFLLKKAIEGEGDTKTEYIAKSKSVFKEHLEKWLSTFGERVAEKSSHPLYQNLGILLAKFMQAEAKIV